MKSAHSEEPDRQKGSRAEDMAEDDALKDTPGDKRMPCGGEMRKIEDNRLEELSRDLLRMNIKYSGQIAKLADFLSARGKYGALHILYQKGAPCSAGCLAEVLGLTPGRVANVLRVLEKEGHIVREKDKGDRRRIMVSLTSSGCQYVTAIYEDAERIHRRLVQEIGEKDICDYIRITKRLLELSDEGF